MTSMSRFGGSAISYVYNIYVYIYVAEVLMKEKQLKHDLDEQVRYPVPVHLLSTNKTVCFRRQQQKPASRRYNRAGHIWTQMSPKP